MKKIFSKISLAVALLAISSACSKFDEINTSPSDANIEQVQVEYFINNSIISAQMDPHVAERAFVLYWKSAARQQLANNLVTASYDDSWTADYWRYISEWLNHANTAIQIAEAKNENETAQVYNDNLIQVARIWRAYLMSELSDNFGSIPIEAFHGENPVFNSTQEVYNFLLDELKDASQNIDPEIARDEKLEQLDPAYGYDWGLWIRYANSMRMRLAMRISEVDPSKAQQEFESAVATNMLITSADHIFQVQEKDGWDALAGVMSREWNGQVLSATLNNLYTGLGGIKTEEQLPASYHSYIKAENYVGKRMLEHYSTLTNDPVAGFFFDGLPYKIDPRAYKTFFIPGDFNSAEFSNYPSYTEDAVTTEVTFGKVGSVANDIKLDTKFTWSTAAAGDFGAKGTANGLRSMQVGKIPGVAKKFRTSQNKRIFFAHWETYFLLAEAALKGWSTGTNAQEAYENAIAANFEYMGVSQYLNDYLTSTDYNRAGTSVSFTHTTEPGSSYTMQYIDGYSGASGTVEIKYPENTIYKNGAVKNDALTKIITQKYIANMPWLPLEAWNDHRRLGLPFFENPAVESNLNNLPALNSTNYMKNQIDFFPQRLKYPSSLRTADGVGYNQAVDLLGGPDEILTPLWWAKKE
ncbi:MAG TPA: SusD/RagB family nutrient-binding outer membrane lipoprotein [Candidatus Sphingobacterium stercoripullorum]|nr:SusD/RagB family nutrient-binding outer membrane lipoprotein [Candidatus Sphingobacterium stercoripullorum]